MSHGIQIFQQNGQLFDENIAAITFVNVYTVGADTSGTLYFPELAGMTLVVSKAAVSASAFGMHDCSVAYGSGYPVLSYYPTGGPAPHTTTQLMVFAR